MWYVVQYRNPVIGKSLAMKNPGVVLGVRKNYVDVRFGGPVVWVLCQNEGFVGFRPQRQRDKKPVLPDGAKLYHNKRSAEITARGWSAKVVPAKDVFILPERVEKPNTVGRDNWVGKTVPTFQNWQLKAGLSRRAKKAIANEKRRIRRGE